MCVLHTSLGAPAHAAKSLAPPGAKTKKSRIAPRLFHFDRIEKSVSVGAQAQRRDIVLGGGLDRNRFGGRIAEELVFGHDKVTTGAQSDIEQATRMARAMVTRFGMSDSLGPIAYAENQEEVFLGHSVSRTQNISEATAQKIDSEIHRIIEEAYERARTILTERLTDLNVLARGLLEYETLTGDEILGFTHGVEQGDVFQLERVLAL